MTEMPSSTWIERLLGRLRRRPMPPRLLDGYTRRVMDRLALACPRQSPEAGRPSTVVRLRWSRSVRWVLAPAAGVAVGVLVWVTVGGRAAPLSQRALTQAAILERLDEPWHADPVDASLLLDDAQQADRFVLAQVPSTAAASAESQATMLNLLDEEPLDPAADDTPEDWLPDLLDPAPA